MTEWEIYHSEMVQVGRAIKQKFGKGSVVTISCNLTSSSPFVWEAVVTDYARKEAAKAASPHEALESLWKYLNEK